MNTAFPFLTSLRYNIILLLCFGSKVVQRQGEVLYLPEGWYHATISESDLTISVTQQPENAIPGSAYQLGLLGTAAFKKRDYSTAIELYLSSISQVDNFNIRRALGECYEKVGNVAAAESEYRKGKSTPDKMLFVMSYYYIQYLILLILSYSAQSTASGCLCGAYRYLLLA